MMKGAVPAVLGFLSLCLPLAAQQAAPLEQTDTTTVEQLRLAGAVGTGPTVTLYQPDIFSTVDSSVLIHSLPVPTVWNGGRFPISSALGQMGMAPLNLFPVAFLRAVEVPKSNAYPVSGKDAPVGMVDLRSHGVYAGGEVGVLYGSSSGKFGGTDFQTYIEGEVGNDRFQITAGASYEEWNGRIPRPGH